MRKLASSVLLVGAALVGCAGMDSQVSASHPSRTRDAFGEAVREARLRQTIDPTASQREVSAAGLDAPAAISAWRRYQDSFREPPPAFEVLGIGTLGR
jgi:hypothetical protein